MKKIILLVMMLGMFMGCSKDEVQSAMGNWQLTAMNGKTVREITKGKFNDANASFTLRKDGSYTGRAFINRYNGKVKSLKGNKINFGMSASTRMGGPAELMKAEREFHNTLREVTNYEMTGNSLVLKSGATPKLKFRKVK